jgi:hypothetical protein
MTARRPVESQESKESHRIVATLVQRAGNGATVPELAESIVSTWQTIEASLTPIMGQRSVAMLYKRSCYLASREHAWLMDMHQGMQTTMNLAALKSALLAQSSTEIASGAGRALQMFYEVLTNLLGASLTERLLQSVWAGLLPAPAQDEST